MLQIEENAIKDVHIFFIRINSRVKLTMSVIFPFLYVCLVKFYHQKTILSCFVL